MATQRNKKTTVITVIGGGSTYTPELIDGLLRRERLFVPMEIRLMDPDSKKLSIVAQFCKRMAVYNGSQVVIKETENLEEAVAGANFIISQIRVGGHEARHRDLELGLRYGLIGQETTGVGGFACALRTIPISLDIAKKISSLAPKALLLNFTNPSGIITEALVKYSSIKVIGLCNIPWLMQEDMAKALGVERAVLELDYVGLNHFTWVYGARVHGKDRLEELISRFQRLPKDRYRFSRELITNIQAIPSPYLQYYYDTEYMLKTLQNTPSRAKEVMRIEQQLLALYQNPKLVKKPKDLMRRGGAYYGEAAAALLSSIVSGKKEIHVVNYPNSSRFSWLPAAAVIEAPWKFNKSALAPVKMRPVPVHIQGMVARLKAYEELTVEAAVQGDRSLAFQALLTNPIIGNASKAFEALEGLLKINRSYLPQFYR